MSYNDSTAYGTDSRRNEYDSTRHNELGDNTRQGEFNDSPRRGGFNDNTTGVSDNRVRSDDYTSGNVGTVNADPTGFIHGTRTTGRTSHTHDNTAGDYGSATTGGHYGSSKTGGDVTYYAAPVDLDDNGNSTRRTNANIGDNDMNTRTGGYVSSNTDGRGPSNTAPGYSKDEYGTTAGATNYGSAITDNHGSSNNDSYGNPKTDNFGTTDRNTYGRGTNATGADDFNAGRGDDLKPTLGEKVKGTMETIRGKITKNPELVERGQERKAGNLDHH